MISLGNHTVTDTHTQRPTADRLLTQVTDAIPRLVAHAEDSNACKSQLEYRNGLVSMDLEVKFLFFAAKYLSWQSQSIVGLSVGRQRTG